MTLKTGLRLKVYRSSDLGSPGGIHDGPFFIEYPDPFHPALLPCGLDNLQDGLGLVFEHAVFGAFFEGVAEHPGRAENFLQGLLLLGFEDEIGIAQQGKEDHQADREAQFQAEAVDGPFEELFQPGFDHAFSGKHRLCQVESTAPLKPMKPQVIDIDS